MREIIQAIDEDRADQINTDKIPVTQHSVDDNCISVEELQRLGWSRALDGRYVLRPDAVPKILIREAQRAFAAVAAKLPPIIASVPDAPDYSHLHVMSRGDGATLAEAAEAWGVDLLAHISRRDPAWLCWRQHIQAEYTTDFATNEIRWLVTSRAVVPIGPTQITTE